LENNSERRLLTPEEAAELARLKKVRALNPQQRVPPELFFADILERPSLSAELAVLRQTGESEVEIYLTQRPADDPFYPSQWHGPGCMIKTNQTVAEGVEDIMRRELGNELSGVVNTQHYFEWLTGSGPGQCPRGHTVCFYHYVWVKEEQQQKLSGGAVLPYQLHAGTHG
jgi:ADP-ribose pyrophosphatase YjhB (NUDIX family)